jgi:hypothetical protein
MKFVGDFSPCFLKLFQLPHRENLAKRDTGEIIKPIENARKTKCSLKFVPFSSGHTVNLLQSLTDSCSCVTELYPVAVILRSFLLFLTYFFLLAKKSGPSKGLWGPGGDKMDLGVVYTAFSLPSLIQKYRAQMNLFKSIEPHLGLRSADLWGILWL